MSSDQSTPCLAYFDLVHCDSDSEGEHDCLESTHGDTDDGDTTAGEDKHGSSSSHSTLSCSDSDYLYTYSHLLTGTRSTTTSQEHYSTPGAYLPFTPSPSPPSPEQQRCDWTGWHTICPLLLSPTAIVKPLFSHDFLAPSRSPSPTLTMSSDNDPADAVFVHPKSTDAASGASSSTAAAGSSAASAAAASAPASASAAPALQSARHGHPGSDRPAPISSMPKPSAVAQNSSSDDAPSSASTSVSIPPPPRKDFWQSTSITNSITAEPASIESSQGSNGSMFHPPPRSRWTKARSTSTESSLSLSGMTTFGSTYNQDGFPNYPASSEEEHMVVDDAEVAKQLALTDEAVRAINGTSSVVQASSLGMPLHSPNTYELPRSMAAYVRRPGDGTGDRDLRTGRSFVSSGSSTSSEESEHLASVQWVTTAVSTSTPQYSYSPYPRPINNNLPNRSTPSMPPPPTRKSQEQSPRHNGNNGTPLPPASSGNGHTISQGGFSAPRLPPVASQPASSSAEGSPDNNNNDDDDLTAGGMREGSPSSSSASGLDLLSHAAAHHERTRYSSSIRRKEGAEAVAQWRERGIPSGSPRNAAPGYDSPGYESTPSAEANAPDEAEPPKKRRKSNMMEAPNASLRKPSHSHPHSHPHSHSHSHSHSSSYANAPSEGSDRHDAGSDYGSDGASDGEYHAKGDRKRPAAGTSKGKKSSRVRDTLVVPPRPSQVPSGKASPATAGAASTGPATSTPKKASAKVSTPTSTKAIAARRGSDATDAAMKNGGVQCEYVNPLPPYQRCPDVFTRKYDIPRHMQRHARREGDLVAEGKLPEHKALLWKTIRDKPRIQCKTCGESFTRQDALKRHQSKQHH